MKAIFKREMLSYFTSPVGYVFIGVFMLLSGSGFREAFLVQKSGNVGEILAESMAVLVLLVPIITMRLLAEEKNNRTDQLLLTAPVKVKDIVLGKYSASLTVFLIALITTVPHILIAAIWGNISWSETVSGYLGYILIGGTLLAIGIFISSLTESQVVAAVLTYGVTMALFYLVSINTGIGVIDSVIDCISIMSRSNTFYLGIISFSNVFYYVSAIFLLLFLTVRKVESRRWR